MTEQLRTLLLGCAKSLAIGDTATCAFDLGQAIAILNKPAKVAEDASEVVERMCSKYEEIATCDIADNEAMEAALEVAIAALPALSQQEDWKPIESVPKEDLVLLGRLENGILAWSQPGYWADGWALPFDSERGEDCTPFLGDEEQPTHWLCRVPKPLLRRFDRGGCRDLNNEGDPIIYGAGEVAEDMPSALPAAPKMEG